MLKLLKMFFFKNTCFNPRWIAYHLESTGKYSITEDGSLLKSGSCRAQERTASVSHRSKGSHTINVWHVVILPIIFLTRLYVYIYTCILTYAYTHVCI